MTDATVYSDDQAALLEAHVRICALVQRYAYAGTELVDSGPLQDFLQNRRDTLESLSKKFEQQIRDQGLMPRDFNVDREDLARLADRFREWLDRERHQRLLQALADRERELLQALEVIETVGNEQDLVSQAINSTTRTIDELANQ